jgi:exoribonuclease-2
LPAAAGRSDAHRAPRPGDLIGVVEARGPQLGVLRAIRGSRGEVVLGPEARPASLPLRTLESIASPPDPEDPAGSIRHSPWRLEESRLSEALPRRRDFAAAWLLLREEGGGDAPPPLSLEAFASLVGNGEDPAQRAACWLWLQGAQTLFRWRQGGVSALGVEELRRLRRERWRATLDAMRLRRWRDRLRLRQPLGEGEPLDEVPARELRLLRQWAAGACEEALGEPLLRNLQQAHCAAEPGAIRHLLADLGQWPRHHLPALEGSQWQNGFCHSLLAEAERLLAESEREQPGDAERLDLTALHTVTIDDDDTADIDDGLSLEWIGDNNPRIWIHVADPGRLIPPDSPLDLEARRRGTSLYLAGAILPMFPAQLATGPFSLRSGRRCPAWSLAIELDGEGAIRFQSLHRSWIRPAYRLSYADADELIELAPPQERDLLHLHALMARRRAWRRARGALLLDQPEGRVRRGEEGADLEIIEPGPGRTLVAEAMILAGAAIAAHGTQTGLALPYRSQPPSELPSPVELMALAPGPVRHAALKRCLSRGSLGTTPSPHFSLALEAYVQATSPIRRYTDLLVQRQLAWQRSGHQPLTEAELAALLTEIEGPVRQGIAISREDQRHWQQVWFEQHPRLEWRALFLRWLRPQDQLGLVFLEELALELPARCPAGSEPGGSLLVRVREVDSLRDQLRLEARG